MTSTRRDRSMRWAALGAASSLITVLMMLSASSLAAADPARELRPSAAVVSNVLLNNGQLVLLPGTTGNAAVVLGSGFTPGSLFQLYGPQPGGMTITKTTIDSNAHATLTIDVASNAVGPYVLFANAESDPTEAFVIQAYVGNGTLFPLATPARVADNRNGIGGRSSALPPGQTWRIEIAGHNGIPSNATAVSLNLTAIGADRGGWLALYPAGGILPPVSSVNFGPGGQIVPNHVIVPLSVDGALDLYNGSGDDVFALVDVDGYFSGTNVAGGLMYTADAPARVLDMRQAGVAIPAGQTVTVALPVAAGSVADVNVTFTNQTAPGWAAVFSGSAASTDASTHNWTTPLQDTANRVAVTVGTGGVVHITNGSGGTIQAIVDLFGAFDPKFGFRFSRITPGRFLDTRASQPLAAGQPLTVDTHAWLPGSPVFVVGNLTGTEPTSSTYFQLWSNSFGTAVPTVSNLNLRAGETRANSFILQLSADRLLNLQNAFGSSNAIVDIFGVFGP